MEEKDKEQDQPIIEQVKQYLDTYIKLARYRAIQRGTSIMAGMITDIFIILGLSITFLFISLTLALYLGEVFHSEWKGFGLVAIVYLIIIAIIAIFRKNMERPIMNALIKKLF